MPNNEHLSLEAFSKVVEAIYDCALNPDHWRETLRLIVQLTESEKAGLGITDHGHGGARSVRLYEYGYDEKYLKLYFQQYGSMNPLFVAAHLRPIGDVYTLSMLVDEQEYLGGRFHLEWAKPQGLHDMISVHALKSGRRHAGLTAVRAESQPRYAEKDIRLYRLLAPHICRTFAISDALDLRTITSQVLEATLDALSTGVYLTDREGRIVYMNRAAEHQIKTGNALRIVNNRLSPVNNAVRMAMTKGIAAAVSDESITPAGGITLALPDDNKAGLVATILPLDRGQRRKVSGPFAATAAIFVQDPEVAPLYPGEAFAKLYDLTGGELRVLLAMAPGLGVKEAADMLGIGENTAKTHLQHIFSKTGTSRQTELLNLLRDSTPPIKAA